MEDVAEAAVWSWPWPGGALCHCNQTGLVIYTHVSLAEHHGCLSSLFVQRCEARAQIIHCPLAVALCCKVFVDTFVCNGEKSRRHFSDRHTHFQVVVITGTTVVQQLQPTSV